MIYKYQTKDKIFHKSVQYVYERHILLLPHTKSTLPRQKRYICDCPLYFLGSVLGLCTCPLFCGIFSVLSLIRCPLLKKNVYSTLLSDHNISF